MCGPKIADTARKSPAHALNRGVRFAVTALILALPQLSYAVTKTWDGGASSPNWNAAANWSPDGVPATTDDVVFDATSNKPALLNVTVQIQSLTLADPFTASLSIQTSSITLRVDGAITINGGTLSAGSGTVSARGDWTLGSNGAFNAGTGNVNFRSAPTARLTGSTTFHRLIIDEAGKIIEFTAGNTFYVTNTLTLTNVTLKSSEVGKPGRSRTSRR
jgi:hypothetical protein